MQIHRGYYSSSSFPYASAVAVLLCMWKARTELIANGYNTKHNLFLNQAGAWLRKLPRMMEGMTFGWLNLC